MKKYIQTLMEFKNPEEIRTMIIQGDEDGIKNLINTILEKRKESKGSEYTRYSKAITILRDALKQIQTNNSLKMIIQANEDY